MNHLNRLWQTLYENVLKSNFGSIWDLFVENWTYQCFPEKSLLIIFRVYVNSYNQSVKFKNFPTDTQARRWTDNTKYVDTRSITKLPVNS